MSSPCLEPLRGLRRYGYRSMAGFSVLAAALLVHFEASADQRTQALCQDDAGAWWRTSGHAEGRSPAEGGDSLWRLIASSDLIVRATFTLSPEAALAIERHDNDHVSILLTVSDVLKGQSPGESVVLRYYPGQDFGGPKPEDILGAAGGKSVFFLVAVAEGPKGNYFARWERGALVPRATDDVSRNIRARIDDVAALVGRARAYLEQNKPPLDDDVASLIEDVTEPKTAGEAVCRLLSLGPTGVPALIRRMDDRRSIAVTGVSLSAPPDNFEALVHYGPETVVDLTDLVLGHIVGESFGFIENGGSELERRRVVDGWLAWLGTKMKL